MIMISAPSQVRVENPDGYPVDSMALTKEGIAPDLVPEDLSHIDTPEPEDEYRLAPATEDTPNMPPVQESEPLDSSWHTAEEPLVPSDQWTSESATRTRQYLLVGFLGASGVALAMILFMVFLRWYASRSEETSPSVAQTSPPSGVGPENATDSADSGASENDSGAGQPLPAGEHNGSEDPAPPASAAEDSGDVENGTNEEATQVADRGGDNLPMELPGNLSGDSTSADVNDVLSKTPEGDPLAGGDASTNAAARTVQQTLPGNLQDFAPVLTWNVQPVLTDVSVIPSAPPLTAEDLGLNSGAALEAIPPLQWNVHSQTPLLGLILGDGQSLSQAINLWTHVTGVPTVVDLDSLAAAGMDLQKVPQSGKITSVSIGQAAQLLGRSLGLAAEVRENRYLELQASREKIRDKLPTAISLEGLLSDDAEYQWLRDALVQLFPHTQGAWTIDAQGLSRDPQRVDLMTWFSVVRLLETWRKAAGVPSPLDDEGGNLFTEFVEQAQLDFLDAEASDVSPQARPVGQALSSVCSAAGVDCWIDWPNVGALGLGPNSEALVVTNQRPLLHVLGDYADLFSLVVAIEDRHTLWVTSNRAYRSQPRLYVLPSGGQTVEQWQQRLRTLTPVTGAGIGSIDLIETPGSNFLLIRCCRPVLRF